MLPEEDDEASTAPASHVKAKMQKISARNRCGRTHIAPGHRLAPIGPAAESSPWDHCRQEQNRHRQRKRDERQELVRTIQQLTQRLSALEADRDSLAQQNQLLLKVGLTSRCRYMFITQ